MKRRNFIKSAAAGAAAAATTSLWSQRAKAAPFGEIPQEYANLMLPETQRAKSVLEVFMYGGVSSYESFYASPTIGQAKNEWLYTFYDRTVDAIKKCGYEIDPEHMLTPWRQDSAGKDIFLGPFLQPLLQRPDVLARMRLVVNRHTLEPHEAAIPLAVTGKTLGTPSAASLGSHVQRYFVDHDSGTRTAPFAYGFATAGNFIPNDNVLSIISNGIHPGAARPLLIKVDNVSRLSTLLGRGSIGEAGSDREKYDAVLNAYFSMYNERLRFGGQGDALRSSKFRELLTAATSVSNSGAIKDILPESMFVRLPGESCVDMVNTINVPAMSLNLATHLLTHPTQPAKHCCVVDTGLRAADGGGGYDTHNEMTFTQSANLKNLLVNLLAKINKPGENDATKIDLDKTMVILNQEFGRTPWRQGTGNGRNHWPYGYVQVYFGGPVQAAQSGIYGTIEETGHAVTYTTPTENRIAALLAMGIYPFDQASFSNSDVTGQSTDAGAIISATKRVLGIEVG